MEGKYRDNTLLIILEIIIYGLALIGLVWHFLPQALV
jgi:hypothetical protein